MVNIACRFLLLFCTLLCVWRKIACVTEYRAKYCVSHSKGNTGYFARYLPQYIAILTSNTRAIVRGTFLHVSLCLSPKISCFALSIVQNIVRCFEYHAKYCVYRIVGSFCGYFYSNTIFTHVHFSLGILFLLVYILLASLDSR